MKDKRAARKTGRRSRYSNALGLRICRRIAGGESLRSIARDPKMPGLSTITAWLVDDEHGAFQEQYARARRAQAELLADEIIDISDDGRNDWMERNDPDGKCTGYVLNGEAVQRSRLRSDNRKWVAARLLARYADRQRLEHTGPSGGPIEINDTERATRLIHLVETMKARQAAETDTPQDLE